MATAESKSPEVGKALKLGAIGGGQTVIRDIAKTKALIAPILRDMLALPAPMPTK